MTRTSRPAPVARSAAKQSAQATFEKSATNFFIATSTATDAPPKYRRGISQAAISRPVQGHTAHDNPLRPLPRHARPEHPSLLSDAILFGGLRRGLPTPAGPTNQSENRAPWLRSRRRTAASRPAPALRFRSAAAGVNFLSHSGRQACDLEGSHRPLASWLSSSFSLFLG